ncbi:MULTISPECIES: hypothetical protein [Acinetobacter]|uniref:hypothetical protein n=1 Tax=Acinetobacter TaxID=469 RepID=UPI0004DAC812|nr:MULTISPECIES: hypothetical protein [Acinetobacter]KEC85449.1 hypothetical protein DT74_20655 [Acinetobacter sp. ETR1]MBP2544847.1 hypothetical protein [Acinetobacter guillouiae]UOH17137.1 hypothetical protein MTO68_15045 [Acinetobacter sp. NyZ410]WEE41027.1 hypothetical protein PYV58_07670 [Acinetobacter sp. TAC-1]
MKRIILISGLLISNFCFGANWIEVENKEGSSVQVDIDSVKSISSQKKLAWTRVIKNEDNDLINSTMNVEVDCSNKTLKNKELIIRANEEVVFQNSKMNNKTYTPKPDSGAGLILKTLCS